MPRVLTGLAALTMLWTRLIPLDVSLFDDEIHSVVTYILPGPAAPFTHYVPNDHMLFELLTWATTQLTGERSDAAYRFWSVVPAIAAAVLMTGWLWRRLDPWVATIFAVLAASSPLYAQLSVEARGYGLAFLAATVMLVAAEWLARTRRRAAVALFAASALMGILTLPVFGLAVVAMVILLAVHKSPRVHMRPLIIAVLIVGVAVLLFYLPVLGGITHSAGQHFGLQLPWYGFITGPLDDLLIGNVRILLPHASVGLADVIAGVGIALGAFALPRRSERFLAAGILWTSLFCYLVLDIGRLYVAARFGSFLLLPLLALGAAGVVEIGRALARTPPGAALAVVLAVAFSVFTLVKTDESFSRTGVLPVQNFKDAAGIVNQTRTATVVTNRNPAYYQYYIGRSARVVRMTPAALAGYFCSHPGRFIYLEYVVTRPERQAFDNPGTTYYPAADTACLQKRGAVAVPLAQQRHNTNRVWLVPALGGGSPVAAPAVAVRGVAPGARATSPLSLAVGSAKSGATFGASLAVSAGDPLQIRLGVGTGTVSSPVTVTLSLAKGPAGKLVITAASPGHSATATVTGAGGRKVTLAQLHFACALPPDPSYCPPLEESAGARADRLEFAASRSAPIVISATAGPVVTTPVRTASSSIVVPPYTVTEAVRAERTGPATAATPSYAPSVTAGPGDTVALLTRVSGRFVGAPQTLTVTLAQGPAATLTVSASVPGAATSTATIKSSGSSPIALAVPRYTCFVPPAPTYCPPVSTKTASHKYTLEFAVTPGSLVIQAIVRTG